MTATSGDSTVRMVTFDVGGTLIHPRPSVGHIYAEVLNRRGFSATGEATGRAFEEAWEEAARKVPLNRERYAWSPGGERGYWRDLLVTTVRKLGGSSPPAGAAEELFERFGHRETWQVFPEVSAVLDELRQRQVTMGILSNWDSRLSGLLRELGLRHYFGPILVSAVEGLEKPDPRIFSLAASRAGVRPEEILHVGDRSREDRDGALEAGCQALLIERNGGGSPGLRSVLERMFDAGPWRRLEATP